MVTIPVTTEDLPLRLELPSFPTQMNFFIWSSIQEMPRYERFLVLHQGGRSDATSEYVIEGIRADCGFADPHVMSYAEENGWEYIFKLPKKATVKKAIAYLQQNPAFWETLAEKEENICFAQEDDRWAATEIPILLSNWEKERHCVIYREAHETETSTDDQLTMILTTYSFQAIITNAGLKPLPLLRSYNQRANVENRIDELKDGYAVEKSSLHNLMRNLLFCWIKVISYNLVVWFKQALLPESLQRCEVKKIRRVVLKVPGNVVGSGCYQHDSVSPQSHTGIYRHGYTVTCKGVC